MSREENINRMITLCTCMVLFYNNCSSPLALINKMTWEAKLENWLNTKRLLK